MRVALPHPVQIGELASAGGLRDARFKGELTGISCQILGTIIGPLPEQDSGLFEPNSCHPSQVVASHFSAKNLPGRMPSLVDILARPGD